MDLRLVKIDGTDGGSRPDSVVVDNGLTDAVEE